MEGLDSLLTSPCWKPGSPLGAFAVMRGCRPEEQPECTSAFIHPMVPAATTCRAANNETGVAPQRPSHLG